MSTLLLTCQGPIAVAVPRDAMLKWPLSAGDAYAAEPLNKNTAIKVKIQICPSNIPALAPPIGPGWELPAVSYQFHGGLRPIEEGVTQEFIGSWHHPNHSRGSSQMVPVGPKDLKEKHGIIDFIDGTRLLIPVTHLRRLARGEDPVLSEPPTAVFPGLYTHAPAATATR